jgi:hypothetical protein
MTLTWPDKDPEEVLDYDLDWTARLAGDQITASTFAVRRGTVVVDSDTNDATSTKAWLSGGSLGETCELTNHVTTAGGREWEQTVRLRIRDR